MSDEANLPWMKFYPSDFMGSPKVRSMTGIQRGIYISLMCKCWQAPDGAIPDNPDELWMECGVTPEQMRDAWPKVRQCFDPHPERDGMLVQPRIQEERGDALERRERARKAGKASGEARRTEQDVEPPVEREAERGVEWEDERDDPPMRASDASEAQRDRGTEGTEVQHTEGSEGSSLRSSPSGAEPRVENSPQDDSGPDGEDHEAEDRKSLAATLRRDALLGQSSQAAETKMASNLDIADRLHDDGYRYGKLEDAVMGARLAIKRREDEFDGWIDPGDTFGMGIFRHADEQGVKLVEVCATYWYKHGEPSANGRSGDLSRATA